MMDKPRVLITGAASGIGKATAIRFAAEGYDVCINDIQEEKLESIFRQLQAGHHLIFPGNYAAQIDIDRGERIIRENWGSLNALVNCAGISGKSDPVNTSLESWRKIFDVMINGCLLVSALALKFMQNGGRIVHITSIHGGRAEKGASSYSMAKSAINQFCRSIAVELADRNILVNAIAPGFVDTDMSLVDGVSELESDWFRKNYIDGHHLPLRRAAQPSEIAGIAFFLAGRDAGYITGQVIVADGGLTITF